MKEPKKPNASQKYSFGEAIKNLYVFSPYISRKRKAWSKVS
jgi:hypothetical protein